MTESVDKAGTYLKVRRERDAAGAKLEAVGQFFAIVSKGLQEHQLKLSNVPGGFYVPMDVPDGASVRYDQWPDKEEVKALLAEYYDVWKKVNAAWANVSPEDRCDLPPPDAGTSSGGRSAQRRVIAS